MSFLDHIEALRWHIIRSFAVIIIAAVFVFAKVEWVFDHIILGPAHDDFIAYKWFCELGKLLHYQSFCLDKIKMEFQNTALAGQFMMSLSVSLMGGFILSFPYIIWELWRFIKPALMPNEIRSARGVIFWCSLLFFTGVIFAYYIVVPYTINFFGNYQLSPLFKNIITIDNYYDTVVNLILAMGIVFELPVFVFFLTKIGIITPKMLRSQRRYAVLILFIIAEIITPPDMFSCLFVFIPLYILFEISVVLSARVTSDKLKKQQ